jgi:hypothetical protein
MYPPGRFPQKGEPPFNFMHIGGLICLFPGDIWQKAQKIHISPLEKMDKMSIINYWRILATDNT